MPETLVEPPLATLVTRARSLAMAGPGRRRVLGIAGPPGAGKSTLAGALVDAVGPALAILVPMDGFHRSNDELVRLGLRDRKGAPATFDADGYVALLERLRAASDRVILAPAFDRSADRVVPGAITVPASVPLVVTEGNYLLLDEPPWHGVRGLLDEAWFLTGDGRRIERLIARHVAHGKEPEHARDWVERSDEANARLVEPTRARADLVVEGLPGG